MTKLVFKKSEISKEKFAGNQFHNILRLFDVLPNFPFNTREKINDYCLQTWYIRVTSRVAEQLKTWYHRKLENIS